MEKVLIEFVDTLDATLKKLQREIGDGSGLAKLTINQFHYIDAIAELGEPTITEIAEKLNITKASVTAGVNKLIQLGYLLKTQSSEDKRVFYVRLTEPGAQLVEAKYKALEDYGAFIRAALTEEEARQLERILAKLVKVFDEEK